MYWMTGDASRLVLGLKSMRFRSLLFYLYCWLFHVLLSYSKFFYFIWKSVFCQTQLHKTILKFWSVNPLTHTKELFLRNAYVMRNRKTANKSFAQQVHQGISCFWGFWVVIPNISIPASNLKIHLGGSSWLPIPKMICFFGEKRLSLLILQSWSQDVSLTK